MNQCSRVNGGENSKSSLLSALSEEELYEPFTKNFRPQTIKDKPKYMSIFLPENLASQRHRDPIRFESAFTRDVRVCITLVLKTPIANPRRKSDTRER